VAGAMKYVRETYNVPAKRGKSIMFQGKIYYILSAINGRLRIWRAVGRCSEKLLIHPTWEVDYLDGKGVR
jgi:hypothetical protein